MPSGPSLLNDSESVQIAPFAALSWMLMSIAMPSVGMDRPLDRVGLHDRRAGLIGEQVDRMRGVVPEQVVGPRARLAERVHVGAAEEVGLHVHLLDMEFVRRIRLRTNWWLGLKRRVWPTIATRPVFC